MLKRCISILCPLLGLGLLLPATAMADGELGLGKNSVPITKPTVEPERAKSRSFLDANQLNSIFTNCTPAAKAEENQEKLNTDAPCMPYLSIMERTIKRHWYPPQCPSHLPVKVLFKLQRDGSLKDLRISQSSGFGPADQSALMAMKNSVPFRKLPEGAPPEIQIEFTFDYNVFTKKEWNIYTPNKKTILLEPCSGN